MNVDTTGWTLSDYEAYRKDFYLVGSNPIDGIPVWKPHALPQTTRNDGQHVWVPPVLEYTELIGDEYQKKREAILKHTNQDADRTTKLLDWYIELQLMTKYLRWAYNEAEDATVANDSERMSFSAGLADAVGEEYEDSLQVFDKNATWFEFHKAKDGTVTLIFEDDWTSDTSKEPADDEASLASSDSDVYLDALSTISGQSEHGYQFGSKEDSPDVLIAHHGGRSVLEKGPERST